MIEAILIALIAVATFLIGALWSKRIYTDKITNGPSMKWCKSCRRFDDGFCLFAMIDDPVMASLMRCNTEAPTMYIEQKK